MTAADSQGQPQRTDSEIREEARTLFVSLLDTPSARRRAAVETWRAADPAHDQAYRAVEAAWTEAETPALRLAAEEADELAGYLAVMDKARREKKAFRGLSALSILLVLLLAGATWLERPNLLQDLAADHVTERGERRSLTLSDGSTVLLDADSALLVEEDHPGERRVRLLRGAAFFEVAHSDEPFVVAAAGGEVRVLGTRFDVRLVDDGGVVTLERGSVAVSAGPAGGHVPPTVIVPGQQVAFGPNGIRQVETVNLDDALAWHGGRYVFYRAPLARVIREVERYRPGRIVITTDTLAAVRVTGSFPLADTEAALASLQASVGFKMTTLAGRLTVISSP